MDRKWIHRSIIAAVACAGIAVTAMGSADAARRGIVLQGGDPFKNRSNSGPSETTMYSGSAVRAINASAIDISMPNFYSATDVLGFGVFSVGEGVDLSTGEDVVAERPEWESDVWLFEGGGFVPIVGDDYSLFIDGGPLLLANEETEAFWGPGLRIEYKRAAVESVPLPGSIVLLGSAIAVLLGFCGVRRSGRGPANI